MKITTSLSNPRKLMAAVALATSCALSAQAQASCSVSYTVTNDWGSGGQVDVVITNNGSSAISGYDLVWDLDSGEAYTSGWNATFTSSGTQVTASNVASHWNGTIGANGGTVSFGFQLSDSNAPVAVISNFTLNGTACGGGNGSSSSSSTGSTSSSTGSSSSSTGSSSTSSSSTGSSSSSTSSSSSGAITGLNAAANMGVGFNIGQTFESYQHDKTYARAKEIIDAYYAEGYTSVRLPLTLTEDVCNGCGTIANPTTGVVNTSHATFVTYTQVVDYALGKDMYVVINAHHEGDLKTYNRSGVLEQLWDDMSAHFSSRGSKLVYQILNEPHKNDYTAMAAADLRYMTGLAYDKIRAREPNRLIAIGGNQWFGVYEVGQVWTTLDDVGYGNDDYLMAACHNYNPWSFMGNGGGDLDEIYSDADTTACYDELKSWSNSVNGANKVGLMVTEMGNGYASESGDGIFGALCNNLRLYYQKVHANTDDGGAHFLWVDEGWFPGYNSYTDSWDNNHHTCLRDGDCNWTAPYSRVNDECLL